MKIRIKGNSLRYRLTRPEVERFATTGYVEEKISFGQVELVYALSKTEKDQLSASFASQRITLYVPSAMIEEWISSERVGFDYRMPLGTSGETLYLLLEKDFVCMDKTNEDQSGNYPNPLFKQSL